jgi:hypothetical protein
MCRRHVRKTERLSGGFCSIPTRTRPAATITAPIGEAQRAARAERSEPHSEALLMGREGREAKLRRQDATPVRWATALAPPAVLSTGRA